MRQIVLACTCAAAMSVAAAAQDTDVKSTTTVKADDANVVSMSGCLERDVAGNFTLRGTIVKGDDELKTTTRVETDVDKDGTEVKSSTRTEIDDARPVGTSGHMSTFLLMPRDGVALIQYVGQQVQIAAIQVDRDSKDAEVKVDEKTTVDPGRGDSSTKRSRTELEIDRGAPGTYTVVSAKSTASSCR